MIELNRSRNNVVLSRRAVLEDERKEMRQAILDRLNPGDVVEGTISNIVDFGAFVDLDGMDGLIHISELSWSHVNHPSEVLEIGQKVNVKVLDIDRERQRISLGLKQTQTDPWQQVLESYNEGDVVSGKVTKVVTFGAFVEILPGVEGLVHISRARAASRREPARGRLAGRHGERAHPRGRRRAAPPLALAQARRRRDAGAAGAGEDAAPPTIDLSEDVFSDDDDRRAPSEPSRRGVDATSVEDEPRRRRRAATRARTKTRRRAESAAEPAEGSDDAVRRRSSVPRPRDGRADGGHRGREERGADGVRAPRCSDRVERRDRARPARARRRRCATRSASAGATTRSATGKRIGEIVFARSAPSSSGSSSCCIPRTRERAGRVARDRRPRRSPSSRSRSSTRRAARRASTRSSSITAPPASCARSVAAPFADREARLIPDEEKVRRADFSYVNDGSLEDLDAFVAGVVEKLSSS